MILNQTRGGFSKGLLESPLPIMIWMELKMGDMMGDV